MPFVNENPVSEADVEKYGLHAIDQERGFKKWKFDWTIDRERDIYLRYWDGPDGREPDDESYRYCFYWGGSALNIYLWLVSCKLENPIGLRSTKCSVVWRFNTPFGDERNYLSLPLNLEVHRSQIIADLKEALIARKGFGTSDEYPTYDVSFEF